MQAPRAPIPHLNHPSLLRRPKTLLGRVAESVSSIFLVPLLLVASLAAIMASVVTAFRPGTVVQSRASSPSRGAPTATGVAFIVGTSVKGPIDRAYPVQNMTQFTKLYGARDATTTLYDAVETVLRKASLVYIKRVAGPAGAVDTLSLTGAAAALAISVDTLGPEDSAITMQVVTAGLTAGSYQLVVFDGGVEKERSPELVDNAAAVEWATRSEYIRVRITGVVEPVAAGPTALAGGLTDNANVLDSHRVAALALISKTLGPGQVLIPGSTTGTVHTALLQHAEQNNRFALLDFPDTAVVATLTAAAAAQRAAANTEESWGFAIGGAWPVIEGVVRNTSRTIAPSAVVAALMADSDKKGNPNDPAAGVNGRADFVTGLTRAFSDADRQTLNDAGVNTLREVYGGFRLYGYRTLVDPATAPAWLGAGNARLRMAITAEADAIAEQFLFSQIDGRGQKIAEYGGALTGLLNRHYTKSALFGSTPDEAFAVDTGSSVNTEDTIANGELRAVLSVRMSPFAELAAIELVKVPITEQV